MRAGLKRHQPPRTALRRSHSAGPNTLRVMEHLLALLRAGGYDGEKLMLAFASLTNYVIGSVIMDNRALSGPETEGKAAELQADCTLRSWRPCRPMCIRISCGLIPEAGPAAIAEDADFEYGLQEQCSTAWRRISNVPAGPSRLPDAAVSRPRQFEAGGPLTDAYLATRSLA